MDNFKTTPQELVEFYGQYKEGAILMFKGRVCEEFYGPSVGSDLSEYSWVMSGKKPVDMSVFSGTGIDCAFTDDENFSEVCYGPLAMNQNNRYTYGNIAERGIYRYARPRLDYWFDLRNLNVEKDIVKKLTNAGFTVKYETGPQMGLPVTHILILGLRDGFCWENEKK